MSILPVQPGRGWAGLWGGLEERHDERRGGEGPDTPISIWKVEASIDELNWALWPPPPHTHTKWCGFVAAGKDAASPNSVFYTVPSVSVIMVVSVWTGWTGFDVNVLLVLLDRTAESVSINTTPLDPLMCFSIQWQSVKPPNLHIYESPKRMQRRSQGERVQWGWTHWHLNARPGRRPLPFSRSFNASGVRGRPSSILTQSHKHTLKTNYPVTLKFFFSAPFVSAG